jgi:hypothetical protein
MKTINLFYWIFTILFSILMFGSAIPDALSMANAVKGIHDGLGYPVYFIPFIGVAKILGVIAILTPGHPRLKEWAYAGLTFDLIAATYSLFCVPQPDGSWYFMILPLLLAAAAYSFYLKKIKAASQDVVGEYTTHTKHN